MPPKKQATPSPPVNAVSQITNIFNNTYISGSETPTSTKPGKKTITAPKKTAPVEQGNKVEEKSLDETILIMGGRTASGAERKMYLLSKDKKEWEKLNWELPCDLCQGGAAFANGHIYIFGGDDLRDRARRLDVEKEIWPLIEKKMVEERAFISNSSVVYHNFIYVFGGAKLPRGRLNYESLDSVEKYDCVKNEWTIVEIKSEQACQKRRGATAVLLGDTVYLSGGSNGKEMLDSIDCLDLQNLKWSPTDQKGQLMLSDGNITSVKDIWERAPGKKISWKAQKDKMTSSAVVTLGNEIYILGGANVKVEIIGGASTPIRPGPDLTSSFEGLSALVIPWSVADLLRKKQKKKK